ncbi:hypothetical protein DKG77_03180 [Flagellimonas aquimarina]|uniref:Uncharacterized protein n=1 Tax=Flagellimonas aquimarina TaxID=2201895 RepID=A0A316L1T9_9FLAO|nr:hypothetical protein [Allomuricauda koreensis]PWL39846.1 hypothetical protein DKG77_03180 [Allomuricauda koreensis]
MDDNSNQISSRWNDILQLWFGGYLNIVSEERRNQISPREHSKKAKLIITDFIGSFIRLFVTKKIPKNKIWFLSISPNNYNALKSIQENVEDSIFVSKYTIKEKPSYRTYYCNYRFRFIYLFFFPLNLMIYSSRNPVKAIRFYDLLFKVNGCYPESLRVLRKYCPKAIVFTNDHEIMPRALLLAAKKLNIPTYYVQHASVSKYFPPLSFDFALLEGEDSKKKYLKIQKTDTKIYLVGMPKFDQYVELANKENRLESIGIAYNAMDDIELLKKMICHLTKSFPDLKFIIRPHPSDQREVKGLKVNFSSSRKENSFEFLTRIDALIASDSSIHLEAVLLNIFSMSYSFSNNNFIDYYGFVQNGLIDHFDSIDDLSRQIISLKCEKPNVQKKAAYYNAAIGSDFYGTSAKKAANIIKETLSIE